MKKQKLPSRPLHAALLFSLLLLQGCGFTVDSAITKCKSKAQESVYKTVPANDFQAKWMAGQWHTSFYQCMNENGFVENRTKVDQMKDNLRRAYPNHSTEQFLADLNDSIRLNSLHADTGYWRHKWFN